MDRIKELETALTIESATSDRIQVDDARRLTGPGLLWDHPGAMVDVFLTDIDATQITALWEKHARLVLDALGWQKQHLTHRIFTGGVNLAISAPMDQLYSAIFAAQTAWHFCAAELMDSEAGDFDQMISDVKGVMQKEANPALIALIAAAQAHGVDILCDDDEVSVGHGKGSQTWPVDALPSADKVDWPALRNIPVAFITGTNGKTTTTRLLEAIARASGKVAGLTSTEFVRVGDDILDRGDYSGPGGGRMLLRDKRLEIACLEVARGGILRRGLPTRAATAAAVTNVANDHLGQYGVNTVSELAQAKFAVHRTLAEGGVLALNADDDYVRAEAAITSANFWWFSLDAQNDLIRQARDAGTCCAYVKQGDIVFFDGTAEQVVIAVSDVPLTMGGAAKYNILNALAALCLALALGLPVQATRDGLAGLIASRRDHDALDLEAGPLVEDRVRAPWPENGQVRVAESSIRLAASPEAVNDGLHLLRTASAGYQERVRSIHDQQVLYADSGDGPPVAHHEVVPGVDGDESGGSAVPLTVLGRYVQQRVEAADIAPADVGTDAGDLFRTFHDGVVDRIRGYRLHRFLVDADAVEPALPVAAAPCASVGSFAGGEHFRRCPFQLLEKHPGLEHEHARIPQEIAGGQIARRG